MRITISAGGIGGISVLDCQSNLQSFISDADSIISSFKTVCSATCDLSGGVDTLQDAVDQIDARVREEENKAEAAVQVLNKFNDFLELATRVDKEVAKQVDKNKEKFFTKYPHLKPKSTKDKVEQWRERALQWLIGAGQAFDEKIKQGWNWVKDTAKKAWDGLVEFYNEHKKIIDTVLIVVGAIAAIAAVVFTGGAALAPLLGALGMSAGAAIAVSAAVAVVAVVSTVASSVLNVVDIWAEIDNPTFNAWQTGLNIVSGVTNFAYSVGNIYNSVKGINPQDYIKNNTSSGALSGGQAQPQPQATTQATDTFDDTITVAKDNLSSERYYAKGNNYDDFAEFWDSGADGYTYTPAESPTTQYVNANDIEGVYLYQNEMDNPAGFWNKRYSKADYLDYMANGGANSNPIEVTRVNNSFYCFGSDGRHRILAAKELGIDIPVIVKGFYTK